MRILIVRFKNLNSLAGDWEIDLQNPVFTSSGIFAITGPTGSGKTTILDAICLALYGQTPRLTSISATTNEIMTRHTGECSAEVTFESSHGVFRCSWYQNRAGKKPGGKLQPPAHEIADASSGIIITTKIKEVAAKVREVTGMDFHQFTRSMLLAQGGFAAFLDAKPDDRSPILEQITGTGIYSEISKGVHERTIVERESLRILEDKAGAITLLSPDEIGSLTTEKFVMERSLSDLNLLIKSLQDRLDLIQRIEALRLDVGRIEGKQKELAARREEAVADFHRLESGHKAAIHETAWHSLSLLRSRESLDSKNLLILQSESATLFKAREVAYEVFKASEQALQQVQCRFDEQRPIIKQVLDLDGRIVAATDSLKSICHTADELKNRRKTVLTELDVLKAERGVLEREKEKATSYLTEHSGDSLLNGAWSGISAGLSAWQKSNAELRELIVSLEDANNSLTAAKIHHDERKKLVTVGDKALAEKNREIDTLQQQVSLLLQGLSISDIRKKEVDIRSRIDLLKKMQDLLASEEKHRSDLQILVSSAAELETTKKEYERIKADLVLHQIRQENLVDSEEKAFRRALVIRDLTEHRSHLKVGDPCPLCGSLVHPYTDEIPDLDKDETGLDKAREQLKEIINSVRDQDVAIASVIGAITANQQEQTRLRDLIKDEHESWNGGAEDIGLAVDVTDRSELVRHHLTDSENLLKEVIQQISGYDERDQKIRTLEQQLGVAKDTLAVVVKEEQDAAFACINAETNVSRLQLLKEKSQISLAALSTDLRKTLAGFQIPCITPESIGEIEYVLTGRRDTFLKYEEQIRDLGPKIADYEGRIKGKEDAVTSLVNEINAVESDIARQREALASLQKERIGLYGEKNPLTEEEHLLQAVRSCGVAVETARKTLDQNRGECDTIAGRIQSLTTSLADVRRDIESGSASFLEAITASGFPDETAYQSALLSASELKSLEAMATGFENEETSLKALYSDKHKALTEAEAENLPGEEIDQDPEAVLRETSGKRDTLMEEIAKISIRLEEDQKRRDQMAGSLSQIDAQRRELQKWERLHALIGSADGKKFRVFAQGLTFQILITQANRHLQVMTDRYLLRPDPDVPLDLAVVDTWQAGDIRSTKNLSGGESFIVSLSLALGLSGMVSKNVRVDSLFLDEGFGTLDDEALDVALGVLSGLHQEGKLIGIISHVPAIKERISARISVEKRGHGRSVIIAPGCRRIT